jgi:hypothetical protein
MHNRLQTRANSSIRARSKRTAQGYYDHRLNSELVRTAIGNRLPVPVLSQRSLIDSDSARILQTIIHSACRKALKAKLPDPSINDSTCEEIRERCGLAFCQNQSPAVKPLQLAGRAFSEEG